MKVVVCLILAVFPMFPITCAKKSQSKHYATKSHVDAVPRKAHSADVISGDSSGILVSADWIRRYKLLEKRHEAIPEDGMIYMEGDKYRIPSKVADHFNEMVREAQ